MSDAVIQMRGTVYENGYGLIAQKVMRDKNLNAKAKAIYAYLCSFAGSKDVKAAFPGVTMMMDELGISSKDTFYKYRKELEHRGYITVEQQSGERGKFSKNIYYIEPIAVEKEPCTKNQETVEPCTKNRYTENPDTENRYTISNSLLKLTDIKIDDDDRAAVPLVDINNYYSIYKFDSKTDFQKAFDEVKERVDVEYAKGTIGSYVDYFEKSFAKEVTKYEIRKGKKQAAATKALELKRSLRGKGVGNKPNLLIVGQQKEGDLQVEINDKEFDENYANELIEAAERRNKERRDVERWQRTRINGV